MNYGVIHLLLEVQHVVRQGNSIGLQLEGRGLLLLSGVPGLGEGEWLEWAVMSAIPTCDDLCGEGGSCFR